METRLYYARRKDAGVDKERERMTKTELHRRLQDHMADHGVNLSRPQVAEFFDEIERTVEAELLANGEFTLPGVGRLTVKDKPARTGRNPATGETIEIAAKRVVKARAAKRLQDTVLEAA